MLRQDEKIEIKRKNDQTAPKRSKLYAISLSQLMYTEPGLSKSNVVADDDDDANDDKMLHFHFYQFVSEHVFFCFFFFPWQNENPFHFIFFPPSFFFVHVYYEACLILYYCRCQWTTEHRQSDRTKCLRKENKKMF